MRPEYFLYLLGYFVLLLAVGMLFTRRMKSLEDFFLASRRLSAFPVYLSLCASWIGASSLLVATDEAYARGLSSLWIMGVPAVATALVFALALAGPIRRLPILSLPDLIEMRYGRLVRHLASILIVWYMALLAASQIAAVGGFFKLFLGTSYGLSLAIGTAVVLVYSTLGGFFTVVVTDGLQFFLLSAGTLWVAVHLLAGSSLQSAALTAERLGKEGYFDMLFDWKRDILMAVSFLLAWLISPIVWQRIQSSRSEPAARRSLLAASATFLFFYVLLAFIGMLGLDVLGTANKGHPLLSEIIASHSGLFLGGLLFVAVSAAIMSTMDTAINTGALSLTHDLILQLAPRAGRGHAIALSRLGTLGIGVMAFLVALRFESILKTLGLASEIMAEGLFIPGMAMLFLHRSRPLAGLFSLAAGGGYAVVSFLGAWGLLPFPLPSWPFSVPYGVGLSAAGFLIGWFADSRRPGKDGAP